MRKIVFLLSLFICVGVSAQELTVKSFVENTRDLTARSNPRNDNNDVPCALVKVQLASAGAVFDGDVMGNVEYKTSEYWVYMPNGSKRLTVKLEGYLPLSIEFPTALESNVTYVLTISGVIVNGQKQEVRTKTGWIILESTPSGASVYINDEFVGNTPLDSYKQTYGTYRYRLEFPNYHNADGILELNSSKVEKSVTLKPAFGSVSVNSSVAGAMVLLDGKNTGKVTPCKLEEIASGTHRITVQMAKYAPRQLEVVVNDGETSQVSADLDARFANVTINTLAGAQIVIDGNKMGTTSYKEDLMEGYYDVEVQLAHHRTVSKQIQVEAGKPQAISIEPTPIYGSLDVMSTPHRATITVDGKQYGQTPITIEELLEGNHKVSFSLDGYAGETREVNIRDGETASVSVSLQNGKEVTIQTDKAGDVVFVDGVQVGTTPYKGLLSFGSHIVYAVRNEKKTFEKKVNVSQADSDISITLSIFENVIKTYTVNGVSFKMIPVEGGTFVMGSTSVHQNPDDDEKPAHRVTVSDYMIGETEVTQALWTAVMGNNPSDWEGKDLPVEQVSWNACQEFLRRLNQKTKKKFRLPTEAEWEFAAGGGNKSQHTQYSGIYECSTFAWLNWNSEGKTHAVKTKLPNELGIYDMCGNVWEWCQDWYGKYINSPQTNPKGSDSGTNRVFRGGSWDDNWINCRVTNRGNNIPSSQYNWLGFRLVLSE